MAFCTQCGAKIDDESAFCTSCGAPVAGEAASSGPEGPGATEKIDVAVVPPSEAAPVVEATQKLTPSDGLPDSALQPTTPAPAVPAAAVAAAPQPAPAPPASPSASKGASKGLIIAIVVIAVALVAALATVAVLMLSPKDAPNGEPEKQPVASDASSAQDAASSSSSAAASSSSASSSASAPSSQSSYILPGSDVRYLSASELSSLSDWELYLARNEIFARHGRGFNNADLTRYFNGQSWYHERYTPAEFDSMASPLNDYERKNSELIRSIEESRNSPYL